MKTDKRELLNRFKKTPTEDIYEEIVKYCKQNINSINWNFEIPEDKALIIAASSYLMKYKIGKWNSKDAIFMMYFFGKTLARKLGILNRVDINVISEDTFEKKYGQEAKGICIYNHNGICSAIYNSKILTQLTSTDTQKFINGIQDIAREVIHAHQNILVYNKSIIEKYASMGYNTIITYNNNMDGAEKLNSYIKEKYKVNSEFYKLDITDEESINNLVKSKEIIEKDIKVISKEKIEVNDEINILDKKLRDSNSSYNLVNNELKNKEVVSGKLEVKLDNLLEELNNSYNLTYESACGNYNLEMDADIAREHVKNLKKELASLGNVNVGAIDEYERISKRYEFLNSQKYDLESASGELKDIIREMDDIMIDKFKNSFDSISKEFSKIFKMMFKGGKGELSLSNPDDLLNTGIDILAIPPGKKINSPLSLSGGEKALTAICLLFAMLEVKPSPFVILDEAEAALDEVNVDMFGKYLSEEKSRSQFIVITHKKRMMEYADSLYGITMQESGVSKIVSAKLES